MNAERRTQPQLCRIPHLTWNIKEDQLKQDKNRSKLNMAKFGGIDPVGKNVEGKCGDNRHCTKIGAIERHQTF